MAMSVLLRSQCRAKVATALSNVCRFTTTSNAPLRLLANKNVTQFIKPITNITPITGTIGLRQISLSSVCRASAHSDHSKLWTIERGVSAALLAILPAAIAFPSKSLDILLAVTVVMHTHWGLEAILVDYIRPVLFGPFLPQLVPLVVMTFSAIFLGLLLYNIFTDIGISQTIRKFWAIKAH